MEALVFRSMQRGITAPLVGYHSRAHCTTDHIQDSGVEEEFRGKAGPVERHRKKMTMRTAVSLVSVILNVFKQDRPEGFSTGIDQGLWQMRLEHAVSILVDLQELLI